MFNIYRKVVVFVSLAAMPIWVSAQGSAAQQLGPVQIATSPGVIVGEVDEDGPAAAAGIMRGDIILEVDGQTVASPGELSRLVRQIEGDSTVLTISRGGEELTLTVRPAKIWGEPFLGIRPAMVGGQRFPLEDFMLRIPDFGIEPFDGAAAMIMWVDPDGPADLAGIRRGDSIVAIEGEQLGPPADLATRLQEYSPGDRITLTYRRGPEEMTADVTLGDHPESGNAYLGVRYAPLRFMLRRSDIGDIDGRMPHFREHRIPGDRDRTEPLTEPSPDLSL